MSWNWIIIEVIAILIENFAILYFLHSRFVSRIDAVWPQVAAWLALVVWGVVATFCNLWFYELTHFLILVCYLQLTKKGMILPKVFASLITLALTLGTSLVGAGVISFFAIDMIEQVRYNQGTSRLLAIIFIKMIQVVIFYFLAKRHTHIRFIRKIPLIVLSCAAVIDLICLLFIEIYFSSPNLPEQQSNMMIWLAMGLLFLMITIFIVYELFIRDESNNIELMAKLQRMELESKFFYEIDAMYKDIKTWRHSYKNNLIALQALIEHEENAKALEYIESIADRPEINRVVLQTGNLVLDAIVSSKLWLAQTQNINVNVHAVYPKNNNISDDDICTLVGNLLDNAIEACNRMIEHDVKRFIKFSLLVKGKNLVLSIENSFNGEMKKSNGRFLTVKQGRFHGVGMPHIDAIVDKYRGHVMREYNSNVFKTHIMLPDSGHDGTK